MKHLTSQILTELTGLRWAMLALFALAVLALLVFGPFFSAEPQLGDGTDSMSSAPEPVGSDIGNEAILGRLEVQRRYEREQEQKIATMLEEVLGTERAVVRVNARLNFNYLEEKRSTVTPGRDVAVNEETHRIVPPGSIESLSVAIWLKSEPDILLADKVRAAVASAVGLDDGRGDSITIEYFSTETPALADEPEAESGQSPSGLGWWVLGGALALIWLIAVGRRRASSQHSQEEVTALEQTAASEEEEGDLTPEQRERRRLYREAVKVADENPEEVAKLIKLWMLED